MAADAVVAFPAAPAHVSFALAAASGTALGDQQARKPMEPEASKGQSHRANSIGLTAKGQSHRANSIGLTAKSQLHRANSIGLTPKGELDGQPPTGQPEEPARPLLLAGARTRASGAVFKLAGHVGPHRFTALVDSGASGPGFINPTFASKIGLTLAPSRNTVQLADGTVVSAAGQVSVDYTLAPSTGASISFTSLFTTTPLESYDIILGVGRLEDHDVLVGWKQRSLEVRTPGRAPRHLRPIEVIAGTEPVAQLAAISVKAIRKEMRRGNILEAYAVLVRPKGDGAATKPASAEAVKTARTRTWPSCWPSTPTSSQTSCLQSCRPCGALSMASS